MIKREDIFKDDFDKKMQKITYHLKSAQKAFDELKDCIKTDKS